MKSATVSLLGPQCARIRLAIKAAGKFGHFLLKTKHTGCTNKEPLRNVADLKKNLQTAIT